MDVNSEAIYGTSSSPFGSLPWGRCTKREGKKKTTLYFAVFDWPTNGKLLIPGFINKPVSAELIKSKNSIKFTTTKDGLVLSLPKNPTNEIASVIKVEIKGKVVIE